MRKLFLMLSFAGVSAVGFAQATQAPAQAPAKDAQTPAAQQQAVDPNAPEFKWESTTIDYGTVNKGDESNATREFKFSNVGKSPLIISNCRGSCGCTVPTCPKEAVLPGAKSTIKVHYDINRVGAFTKTVTVSSNATTPNTTLKIQGTVVNTDASSTTPTQPANPTVTPTPGTHPH